MAPPPMSVELVFWSWISISQTRSLRLEFRRINSPSIVCWRTEPSGLSTLSSFSFRVA